MKRPIITVFILILCLSCNPQKKGGNQIEGKVYTFEEFKAEFQEYFDVVAGDTPFGTWFWDEFGEYETQYNLTDSESKLLGQWGNVTFSTVPHYYFYPNKFFVLDFLYKTIQINGAEGLFLDKVLGIWDITNGIVSITVHAVMIRDGNKKPPNSSTDVVLDLYFLEHAYTVDFISIDDIGEERYTKRTANNTILSEELQKQVMVLEPRTTSNSLYVRVVYSMDFQLNRKYYGYFTFFPDMAQDNVSGFEIATNPELIRKYIPDWLH